MHLLASFLVRGGLDRGDLGGFGIGGGGAMLRWEEGLCNVHLISLFLRLLFLVREVRERGGYCICSIMGLVAFLGQGNRKRASLHRERSQRQRQRDR